MDDQQRARELLALGLEEYGHYVEAENVRKGIDLDVYRTELWSITAALRAAPECPEGFVIVPEIATEAMLSAAYPRNERIDDDFDRQGAWADCLAARPQGEKDA